MNTILKIDKYREIKNKNIFIDSSLEIVLSDIKARSVNTFNTYSSAIEEFMKNVYKKSYKEVKWDDLEKLSYGDLLSFRNELIKKGNSNRTINIKIASITSILKELYKFNSVVPIEVLQLKRLPEYTEENKYGSLTELEVNNLIEYCYSLDHRRKPVEKALFFKVAYVTAIRQGALLKMKWSDIFEHKDGDNSYMVINVKDKGKTHKKAITKELYDELLTIKTKDPRVFPTTRKTLSKVLHEYCKEVGIDYEKRNIVLHSLKKSSVDKVYKETGDITKTARHANHSNIELVYQTYQGRNTKLEDSPSLTLFTEDKKDKKEILEKYSKEQLIQAIMKQSKVSIGKITKELERRD